MEQDLWSAVDDYIVGKLAAEDNVLRQVLEANEAAGLPAIDVSQAQGKLLYLLARMMKARRVLEIGTLGGFSTIWLARALPADGLVVTLEAVPEHAAVARANFERAGLSGRIDLRLGLALDSLAQLAEQGGEPFDFIFIDADKPNNPNYLGWALKLARPGTVIVSDNVVRDGEVTEPGSQDPSVQGIQQFFDMMAAEPRLDATAVQTVGVKGWDGFSIAIVD
jgi:predicted O-methyltransferase YrrM